MERPHSRKKTVAEGTAVVKKGEKVEGTPSARAEMEAMEKGEGREQEEKKD